MNYRKEDILYIIIPAYNEAANIESVVNEWYPVIEKYNTGGNSRLVIIDDGSKDNTYSLLCNMAVSRSYLIPLTKKNQGHGATVLYGYKYALEHNADYIFQTDSDGQTLPSEFHAFWAHRSQYDMIIGKRCHRQDGISRKIVTGVLRLVIRICFHVSIPDANTPFRLLKSKTLQNYIAYIPKNYNLSNVLLSVIYAKNDCRVKYVPITFRPRQGGMNSINIKSITKIGFQAIKDFFILNKQISR